MLRLELLKQVDEDSGRGIRIFVRPVMVHQRNTVMFGECFKFMVLDIG